MALKRWIKNFFGFSRAQANGFIILLPLVAMTIFSVPFMRWWTSRNERDFSKERSTLDSLAALWNQDEINVMPGEEARAVIFFPFDPNTASEEELSALGFSPGLARRLVNYRAKGGSFKIKPDLMKLYGMDSLFYASLESFIQLPEKMKVPEAPPMAKRVEPRKTEIVRFNLNHADTTLLKTVYGIGSTLSKRIVQYRESLGGFVSSDQLYKVYGLDSVVIERLLSISFLQEDFQPKTLNINTVTEEELAVHPYISRRMARAMVTYRFQHGKYHSVEDLRKILQLDEQQLNSIRPYLTVD
jgi:competence protein ComEA